MVDLQKEEVKRQQVEKRGDFRIPCEEVKIENPSFKVQKIPPKKIWNFKILLYYYLNKEFQTKSIKNISKNTLPLMNIPSKHTLRLIYVEHPALLFQSSHQHTVEVLAKHIL